MSLKVRKNRSAPPPQTCALTECMAVIAGAWAPNVIWHLRAGPRRFSELRLDIPPISAKVLSQRLRELESRGVITRSIQPTTPPSVEYALTPLGQELVPALDAIVEVGHKLKAIARQQVSSGRRTIGPRGSKPADADGGAEG
ncbi:transcriptional regulator (plasmid) [Azospirillum humicireducens]|uniref:Transcriptional regulator n=1 Tax=Azospirillum humicireducens TaxID=1226968 RepID=A0A2R4VV16_9PROT|nr:helix-turn-helix domain-containing protein [Azospirillum humicireducens]AWB08273.1 transcriptional regulator [Azospirillum humicireducens]